MQILLATHFYPPGHLGGTEVLTRGLAQSLHASGHSVVVVCVEDWETAASHRPRVTREAVDGVRVTRLRFNWKKAPDVFGCLYNNPEVESFLFDLMGQIRFDVLHITSCHTLSASVVSAARRRGVPVVLSATDFWFLCARNTLLQRDGSLCDGPDGPWKCARCLLAEAKIYRWPRRIMPERLLAAALLGIGRWPALTNRRGLRGMLGHWSDRLEFLRQSLGHVDLIVTASEFLRDLFVRHGVPPERVLMSAYGLATEWATGFTAKSASSRLRVGFIGQIIPAKGPDLLVRAMRSLPPELPVDLVIYGDLGKSPGYSEAMVAKAGGDQRISFQGTFDNDQMGRIMTGIDVLAVPSVWYDFPLVIPSAFATNTPVLATRMPGMNEWVVDDVNGLLFNRGDWKGLARCIERLVADPPLLARLCAGIPPVRTIDQVAAECEGLYRSARRPM